MESKGSGSSAPIRYAIGEAVLSHLPALTHKKGFLLLLQLLIFAGFPAVAQTQENRKLSIISQGPFTYTAENKQQMDGNVRLELPGVFLITTDKAGYDPISQIITATGNVKVDYQTSLGVVEITAAEINYNLADQSGTLTEVTASFGNELFFVGDQLEILNKGERFLISKGTITACNQPVAQWSIRISSASVEREGYAHIKGARFRVKDLPIIHIPYLILPAMQKRRSGLLTPDTGRSERNGAFYNQPIYWAPRQDLDFTFTPTWYEKAGGKLDLEARYTPRLDLTGALNASLYQDKIIEKLAENDPAAPMEDGKPVDSNRYRIKWRHDQNLFKGHFELRVDAGSDFSVDRDFLRSTEPTRIRDYRWRGSYDRDVGRAVLYVDVESHQRILARDEEVIGVSSLPRFAFYSPNRHIGKGFYLRNYLYSAFYKLDDLGPALQYDGDLVRIGIDSEISKSQNLGRFIHTRWGAGYQGAFYSQSGFEPVPDQQQQSSDLRGSAFTFVEAVGPRLQRIYNLGNKRIVHYLDVLLDLRLGTEEEDPFLQAVQLDELDIRLNEESRGVAAGWKINSRFFAGKKGEVRPVLEMELGQAVDLENNSGPASPIEARFRLLNLGGVNANGIFEYNPDHGQLDTLSLYNSVNWGLWTGYGGYVKKRDVAGNRESFIGISRLSVPSWRSNFKLSLDYDFKGSEFKSQEFAYTYQGQCVGAALSYVKSPFDSGSGGENRDFFQITFSLRNLGDLGTKL